MRCRRGCAGGTNSAAGRHCRGACAAAGPSGSRRFVGVILGADSFVSWYLCRCVFVVGYDLDRVRDWDYAYQPVILAVFVYCFAVFTFVLYWVVLNSEQEEGADSPIGYPG